MAYFLSRGFINTGLGRRIAMIFVRLFGKRTLGLSYALIGVDLVTAPATPSNTARAGGIVMPIIDSLSESFGSTPKDGTQSKIGSYLMFTEFHGNIITSGMFMTAMAPNLVAVALAKGMHVQISWMGWFIAALVPGIICLVLVPWLIYKMYPPEIKETPNAKEWADKELAEMGKMSLPEKIMATVFVIALFLWMISSFIGLEASTVAFLAVVLLLLTGVLSVKDILNETGAWNTIIWFSILIFMANELNVLGLIPWLSKTLGSSCMVWVGKLSYWFWYCSTSTATTVCIRDRHVTAMYGAYCVAISAGAPATFAAMILGFTGAIFGSTTQYANGPASALFALVTKQSDWWRLNFILGIVYIIVWGGIGSFDESPRHVVKVLI